jgi:hypothetical protein
MDLGTQHAIGFREFNANQSLRFIVTGLEHIPSYSFSYDKAGCLLFTFMSPSPWVGSVILQGVKKQELTQKVEGSTLRFWAKPDITNKFKGGSGETVTPYATVDKKTISNPDDVPTVYINYLEGQKINVFLATPLPS